jgi:hypothetical protein
VEQANQPYQQGGVGNKLLTSDDYDLRIVDSTVGVLPDGTTKFLFLRGALPAERAAAAWTFFRRLRFGNVRKSNRKAFRKSHGGEMVMGYLPTPKPRKTSPTRDNPLAYNLVITPLCMVLGNVMDQHAEHLPTAVRNQGARAAMNGPRLVGAELRTLVDQPGIRKLQDDGSWRTFTDADIPLPQFSTVQINESVICPSHRDSRNASGFSCLTAFGRWAGGDVCFPRLRVAFALKPGDVLIADMQEQHGNVAPLAGVRVAVVCYLRTMPPPSSAVTTATSTSLLKPRDGLVRP